MRAPPRALVFLWMLGCGDAHTSRVEIAPVELAHATAVAPTVEPHCQFEGPIRGGALHAPNGGFEYGTVNDGRATGALFSTERGLALVSQVASDGWTLQSRSDPRENELFHTGAPLWLSEDVALVAGARVRVLDARPGEVQITTTNLLGSGVAFVAPVTRWIPCSIIGVVSAPRREAAERSTFGLPPDPPTTHVREGVQAALSREPGGAPFVEVSGGHELRVLEERGEYRRVLLHSWTGTLIVGWVEADRLGDGATYGLGGLGLRGGSRAAAATVCTSEERLVVHAAPASGRAEPVGWLAPGTPFERVGERDGALVVRPRSALGVSAGVAWLVSPSTPPICVEEAPGPLADMFGAAPDRVFDLSARVTAVRGLSDLRRGATCSIRLEHRASGQPWACRAEVRCGERVLFGDRTHNGFFSCTLAGDPPVVQGTDEETSSASGDASMTLDSQARRLVLDDDAQGQNGAFHLEARIESFRPAP